MIQLLENAFFPSHVNRSLLSREGQDWTFLLKKVSLLGQLLDLKKTLLVNLLRKALERTFF